MRPPMSSRPLKARAIIAGDVPVNWVGASSERNATRTASAGMSARTPAAAPASNGLCVGPASSPCACSMLSIMLAQSADLPACSLLQHALEKWVLVHLGGKETNQVLVGLADRSGVSVEVYQPHGVDVAQRLPEGDVPVDLIGERRPGEAHDRHARSANELNVVPLPPQPSRTLAGVQAVGLRMHHRAPVTVVVLARDGIPAEQLTEGLWAAGAVDELLVPFVVIDPEDGASAHVLGHEPGVFLRRHAVLVQVGQSVVVHGSGIEQIQRQEASLVLEVGDTPDLWVGAARLVELATLAVNEHGVRPLVRYGLHHQHVGLGEVTDGGDEGALVPALLVPEAIERAELRADVHLVDGRIEMHPRISPGKRPRVLG